MRKFKLASLFLLLVYAFSASSQDSSLVKKRPLPENPDRFSWDKMFIGGNLGISRYYINVSPMAGYMVKEKVMVGAGVTYISFGSPYYPEWLTIYGGKVFGRYYVFPFAFAHAELEELNGPWDPLSADHFWINTTLVGGGYRQHVGGSLYLDMMILFNINDNLYSPYQNPIIRMGVNVGL